MKTYTIKPQSMAALTTRTPIAGQGITFNEAGISFNEPGIMFGGNTDPFNQGRAPQVQLAQSIKPINSTIKRI